MGSSNGDVLVGVSDGWEGKEARMMDSLKKGKRIMEVKGEGQVSKGAQVNQRVYHVTRFPLINKVDQCYQVNEYTLIKNSVPANQQVPTIHHH